jgi:hypothetical protein
MDEHESLNHRQYLGEVFRKLAEQKESRIEEGHLRFCRKFSGSCGLA